MNTRELITLAKLVANRYQMDPALCCALCEQESGFDPYAIRCESESGFMTRYGDAYQKIVAASADKQDDKWIRFEDIFYSSYGLMQTMYPVIIENFPEMGKLLMFPTKLCDPEIGLGAGCRLYMKKLKQANNDVRASLLLWNGGSAKGYPDEVLARVSKYQ